MNRVKSGYALPTWVCLEYVVFMNEFSIIQVKYAPATWVQLISRWIRMNMDSVKSGYAYLVTESFAASNFAARSFTADSFAVDSFAASSFAARQFRPKPVSPRTVSPRIVSPRAVLLGPPPWNRFFRHFRLFWARKKIFFLVQKFFLDLKNFQEKKKLKTLRSCPSGLVRRIEG